MVNIISKMDMQDITNIQANTDLTKSETNQKNELEIKFKKMKEKEDFYQRLVEFHRHKNVNTPIINFPTLNGKLIDLQKLYNIVISLGGWEKVCEKDKWSEVGLNLDAKLFKSCLNGAHAIKTIYIRYLSLYEKFDFQLSYGNSLNQGASLSSLLDPLHNFNNPSLPHSMTVSVINPISNLSNLDRSSLGYHKNSAPNLEDTIDTDINRKKFSYLLDSTPMNYTYSQHILNNTNNSHLNPNPYEKLEISLLCGLPNEVDFVFNTMILLSSEENNTFKIYQSPRLISLMLAHVGFFGDNDKYNLKNLYDKYWFKQVEKEDDNLSKEKLFEKYLEKDDLNLLNEKYEKASQSMCSRNFPKFWTHIVNIPDEDFGQKILLNEIIPNDETFKNNVEGLNLTEIRSDLNETILPYTIEYKRIEQVLIILNNLSFEDLNADFMANKCQVLFEFLLMCLYSNHPIYDIKKHALDIWANISRKLKLNLLSEKNSKLFLNALYHVLIGQEEIQYLTIEENDENEELVTKMVPVLDRLGLIRGLEILTKLCTQEQLDTLHDDESINNEKIISKFSVDFKNGKTMLLLERVFKRLDEILPVQDILILLHSLEFMYNITQFNQFICNLIFDSCSSMNETGEQLQCKLIQVLINFLSIDMSHFGVTNNDASNRIKMYKIVPSNGQIVAIAPSTQTPANSVTQSNLNSSAPVAQNAQKNNSLLQQTLNNQHQTTTKPQPVNAPNKIPSSTNNDQHAKNILSNWLITCFQTDSNSELSKTQLYPYYQQISKYNNWPVLTIPTFFEILNSTFPHLRYDEDSNKIHGLKLVLNLKQQLELKQKFANISSTPVNIPTQSAPAQQLQFTLKPEESNKISICPLSPPPSMSINIPISSMNAPLMTPPPPIEMPLQKNENEQQETKNVLINGDNKTNFVLSQSKESVNNESSEIISQNEDSLMSNSSSSTNAVSASNSTTSTKLDEKSNKENDFNLKRKNEIINDSNLTESKQQISKILNESTQESSPVKKKKLKINEMEDFMNKPMAPITIVSNQFSNTIQIQFKTDQIPQPILIANSTTPSIRAQSVQTVVQQVTNQHNIVQQQVQQIPQNVQVVQISQTDNQAFAQQQHHQQIQQQINNGNYLCEWNNCNSFFASAKAVYNHVCKYHLFNTSFNSDSDGQLCLWSGCDQVKRQKWSLVNHIQERHCNENTMKHAIMCRQQGIIKSVNNQNLTNNHLNYSKDAAYFAIQRHHRLKKEDFLSPPEGPITKSIRLLSALTLRNMARNSEKAKKIIQNYESQLACIAFDLLESSNAISSCLWHLSH